MKYLPSPSIILSFTLGGLVLGSHLVFGFTEPTQLPGGGNVFPPLDVSATAQAKAGGLILNAGNGNGAGGGPYGLIVDQGSVIVGNNYLGGILNVQGATSSSLVILNQTGAGDTATFQADGSTLFSIGRDGLCWSDVCKTSWADVVTPIIGTVMVKSSDGGGFSSQASDFNLQGDVTLSNDAGLTYTSLYGYHYYDNLTIPEGVTVKVPAGKGGLALIVRNNLTIRGTINADGAAHGGNGHAAGGKGTGCGYQQMFNGESYYQGYTCWDVAGSPAVFDGTTIVSGTSDGTKPAQAPASYIWTSRYSLTGGSSGGSGVGGGDILLIAGNLNFKSTARISSKGSGNSGSGNVIIQADTVIDEGAVYTLTNASDGGANGQVVLVAKLYTNQYVDTSGLDLANKTQTFNPGKNSLGTDHFFTVPAGVTSITVEAWGAGGGGGAGSETSCVNCYPAYGGGGGGGAYVPPQTFSVTPGQNITAIAGEGGVGASGIYTVPGGSGGNTIFGTLLTVAGGAGGTSARDWGASGSGGGGGTTNISGGINGSAGSTPTGGQGGNGGAGGDTHTNGSAPAGGGGGGYLYRTGVNSGGTGGGGKIIVRW